MKLKGMTFFELLWNASVKRYKALDTDWIAPAHAQSAVFVCKHCNLSKALIQLTRNIEDHAITQDIFYSIFCVLQFILQSTQKVSPKNCQFFCG